MGQLSGMNDSSTNPTPALSSSSRSKQPVYPNIIHHTDPKTNQTSAYLDFTLPEILDVIETEGSANEYEVEQKQGDRSERQDAAGDSSKTETKSSQVIKDLIKRGLTMLRSLGRDDQNRPDEAEDNDKAVQKSSQEPGHTEERFVLRNNIGVRTYKELIERGSTPRERLGYGPRYYQNVNPFDVARISTDGSAAISACMLLDALQHRHFEKTWKAYRNSRSRSQSHRIFGINVESTEFGAAISGLTPVVRLPEADAKTYYLLREGPDERAESNRKVRVGRQLDLATLFLHLAAKDYDLGTAYRRSSDQETGALNAERRELFSGLIQELAQKVQTESFDDADGSALRPNRTEINDIVEHSLYEHIARLERDSRISALYPSSLSSAEGEPYTRLVVPLLVTEAMRNRIQGRHRTEAAKKQAMTGSEGSETHPTSRGITWANPVVSRRMSE